MSLPGPPPSASLPPRPRISSSPSPPYRLSGPSVPKSRPPLGQPGTSFVTTDSLFMILLFVPSHRASSSEAVAWGELPCSFLLEVSERVPAQPTASRKTAHPIRKATTKAISCPWRATTPSPSSHVSPATSTTKHATQLTLAHLSERLIHRSAWKANSKKFGGTEFSEVQRRCVGMGGASAPSLNRFTRSLSHLTSSLSAAILAWRSSRVSSSICL